MATVRPWRNVPEPDYKRPFERTDFRGYFAWTAELTDQLAMSSLYHACHEDELRECLGANELGLRSSWALNLPEHGKYECPGVWTGLNYFNDGNRYGPLLMEFPLDVLNGRHFMVFRRDDGRKRYFFVQYEARVPVYSFGTADTDGRKSWRVVDPAHYFEADGGKLTFVSRAIYDLVLTHPLSLDRVKIRGVSHHDCIPGKCTGSTSSDNSKLAAAIGAGQIQKWVRRSPDYAALIGKFPEAEGETIELKKPRPASTPP